MEGKGFKSVLLSALILGLVLEHIQVEADNLYKADYGSESCCPSAKAKNLYNVYRMQYASDHYFVQSFCANFAGCKLADGKKCEPPYDHLSLSPHSDEAGVIDFCKLGCTSSVCNKINAFVGSEELNDAVERCNNACYRFCSNDVDIRTVVA